MCSCWFVRYNIVDKPQVVVARTRILRAFDLQIDVINTLLIIVSFSGATFVLFLVVFRFRLFAFIEPVALRPIVLRWHQRFM